MPFVFFADQHIGTAGANEGKWVFFAVAEYISIQFVMVAEPKGDACPVNFTQSQS